MHEKIQIPHVLAETLAWSGLIIGACKLISVWWLDKICYLLSNVIYNGNRVIVYSQKCSWLMWKQGKVETGWTPRSPDASLLPTKLASVYVQPFCSKWIKSPQNKQSITNQASHSFIFWLNCFIIDFILLCQSQRQLCCCEEKFISGDKFPHFPVTEEYLCTIQSSQAFTV